MGERNIVVSLECFIRRQDKDGIKYLMLQRGASKKFMPGVWMAPGGKLDPGEGLFACARREIREETGLEIKNLRIWARGVSQVYNPGIELHYTLIDADLAGGTLTPEADNGELHWLKPEEILKLDNLLGELPHLLPHLFENRPGVISCKSAFDFGNHMTHFEIESSD